MINIAVTEFGSIDVLVTAAGITHQDYLSGNREAEVKMAIKELKKLKILLKDLSKAVLKNGKKLLMLI